MNARRRWALSKALDRADVVRCELEAIRDDEQEAYDNLPESLQGTGRGEAMLQMIERIEDAVNALESIEQELRENV